MRPATEPGPLGGPASRPAGFPTGLAVGFYAVLAAGGWLWRYLVDGVGPWSPAGGPRLGPVAGTAAGLAVGLGLVWITRLWTRHSASGRALHAALAEVVTGLGPWACAALALASSVGEEVLFRGALQPRVGWLLASLLFGLAHFVPRPGLRVWALFAALAGAVFGLLYTITGSLLAPIVAHGTVNALNLHWLANRGTDLRGNAPFAPDGVSSSSR